MAPAQVTSLAAAVALVLFAILAFVDGIWLHLLRLRLHARPESRLEHALHTGRAILTPLLLLTLFGNATGPSLWAALALLAVDQALEVADMAVEKRSRHDLGGLSTGEYGAHGALITSRAVAIALALALRPSEAWHTTLPTFHAGALGWVSAQMVPGAVVAALAHLTLACWPGLLPMRTAPDDAVLTPGRLTAPRRTEGAAKG